MLEVLHDGPLTFTIIWVLSSGRPRKTYHRCVGELLGDGNKAQVINAHGVIYTDVDHDIRLGTNTSNRQADAEHAPSQPPPPPHPKEGTTTDKHRQKPQNETTTSANDFGDIDFNKNEIG